MKKLAVIVLTLIALVIVLWATKVSWISAGLSRKLGVPISMQDVTFRSTHTEISGFKILNPKGFRMRQAFSAQKIRILYDLASLRNNPTIIDRIELDQVYLGVECINASCTKNNWSRIGSNILKKKSRRKGVLVRKLAIRNISAEIKGYGPFKVPLTRKKDYIEINNIQSDQGFPTDELIIQLFGDMGLQEYLKEVLLPKGTPLEWFRKMIP